MVGQARQKIPCEQFPVPAFRFRADGKVLETNRPFLAGTHASFDPPGSFMDTFIPSSSARLAADLASLADHEPAFCRRLKDRVGNELLWTFIREKDDGAEHIYLAIGCPCSRATEDELPAGSVTARDISDRLAVEAALRASEQQFRAVFEQAGVGVAQVDVWTGAVVKANRRFYQILGYGAEEVTSLKVRDITHPDDFPKDRERLTALLTGTIRQYTFEKRYLRKDGSSVWVSITVSPMWEPGEEPRYCIGVVQDVSDRKAAEEALHQSEASYRSVLEHIQDVFYRTDEQGHLIMISQAGVTLLGYDSELEMLGRHNSEFWAFPEQRTGLLARLESAGNVFDYEVVLVRKDGVQVPVSTSSSFYRDADGTICGIEGVFRDITERKQAESELLRQKTLFESLFAGSPEAIAIVDRSDRVVAVNRAFTTVFGYDPSESVGRPINDLVASTELCADAQSISHEVVHDGKIVRSETVRRRKDGSPVEVAVLGYPILIGNEITGAFAIYRDITNRKLNERKVRESEERFAKAFHANPGPIVISDIETGLFLDVNERWLAMLGHSREETIGHTSKEIGIWDDPEHRDRMIARLKADGSFRDMQTVMRTKTGDHRHVLWSAETIMLGEQRVMLSLIHDVTAQIHAEEERRQLEEHVRQAQKMEAIGTLAGGIAHDFNNLLTTIMGNVALIQHRHQLEPSVRERIRVIEEMVQRGADLTKQLLGFAKGGKYEVRPADLNRLVEESLDMFGRAHREITIGCELIHPLPPVEIDRGQMHQVLLNIFINAAQAMPSGGTLTIRSAVDELDGELVHGGSLLAGTYVRLAISDTGHGMDEKTMQRVFDPFFTTKPVGKGTGLGLASAYGIVKNHGGSIQVASSPGGGSTFTIHLPASRQPLHPGTDTQQRDVAGGLQETILVIDDEEMILAVSRDLLQELGYRVLIADSGVAALQLVAAEREGIDLVILDMVLPDMDGSAIFDRLRELVPDIKVLLASGYSVDERARAILARGCRAFIQKPYSLEGLANKVREVLDCGAGLAS